MGIKIENAYALLRSGSAFEVKQTDIYLKGDKIAGVGKEPEGFQAEKRIDGKEKLVIPGLINCHTHGYMTVFRNYADDLSFDDWLMKNIMPMEDKLVLEDGYWGSMLACMEMIKTGTTCFLDMHMFQGQSVRAADEAGMRAVISRGLSGQGDDEGGKRRIREALAEMDEYKKSGDGRISFMLAPHAIYTCDNAYLETIIGLAKEKELGIHVHVSESLGEIEGARSSHNCSPVELLEKLGCFDVPTVAAHCVQVSEADMDILAAKKVSVATNPVSNLKLGNGFAPLTAMQKKGINICIGTDGAASNNALNLFREMGAVTLIHKGFNHDVKAVSAMDALNFATVNGAKALGLSKVTGKIEEGCKADLAIMNLNTPVFQPKNNLAAALAYSATGYEVETVIIDGKLVMENNILKSIDEERVYYEVNKITEKFKK